jgi:3-deoxy-7-phosphoheptulonate synthase
MKNQYIYNSTNLLNEINISGDIIGGNNKVIIAGPCTFGSYDELYKIAKQLKNIGIKFLRGGAYKARTNPYSFQGLQDKGIEILLRVKEELGIKIVTELLTIEQVKKYADKIDIIQIGSRNMHNYELLKEVGKSNVPVILKRGFCASYEEWLLAAEYILKEGNSKVILCERGIRNNISSETRNTLDIQAIPYIKNHTSLPIIVDPSHASGKSYMVESMSKASLVAGANGLIIEVHTNPEESLCDSEQTININELKNIIEFNKLLENVTKENNI